MALDEFETWRFEHEGIDWPVYQQGQGPGVVIMHEIPGITPPVVRFAERVAEAGFTAVMPQLFGEAGRPLSAGYAVREMARACINREFHVLAKGHSSPITNRLRTLCRVVGEACPGTGVGALGMCLTGNFALALAVDPWVVAPVLSQPSLPFGLTAAHRAAPHASQEVLSRIKERHRQEGLRVLALRFSHDMACPAARFRALEASLGDAFKAIEIDSGPGNPHGIPRYAHSVLTNDLVDRDGHPTRQALDRVLGFFAEHLR